MTRPSIAIVHYSASPVVGGVEAVIDAHATLLVAAGYPTSVVAGRGAAEALPAGVRFVEIPAMDSRHPAIVAANAQLETGTVPAEFEHLTAGLVVDLGPVLAEFDHVIVHNIFSKHFNLPLTAALFQLLDEKRLKHTIAWGHDFTWTSPNSRSKVFEGDPWDLLRTYRRDVRYVVVSEKRRHELADLLQISSEEIAVVYNGVSAAELLGLSGEGAALIERLELYDAGLILLMPVRVTTAKNIEFALRVVAALKQLDERPFLVLTGPPDPHDEQSMEYFTALQGLRTELGIDADMRFVYESGPAPDEGFTVPLSTVGDLFRIADVMFMPSHREGFGMPILEAGLAGVPIAASRPVPAAVELAEDTALLFHAEDEPAAVARRLVDWLDASPEARMRRRVRRQYTWDAIFRRDIEPLLRDSWDREANK